jgi:hypothetical protein
MLKPLTFSLALSLAVALGFSSVSKAGGLDSSCTTCGLASPQGGPYASGQGGPIATGCESPCAPKKHCFSFHLPKIHCNLPKLQHTTSYEWVLKKKHCFSLVHAPKETCGSAPCATGAVYPSGQGGVAPSGQGAIAPSGQGAPYAAPQVYGAGQHAFLPARPATIASVTEMTPAIPGGEEAPPAPEVKETSAIGAPTGGLLLPTPSGN